MSAAFDMSEFLGLFLEEATELLASMDADVVALEKAPDDLEIVRRIFRAAHTLKASAASQGFTTLSEVSHALENMLSGAREGTLRVTAEAADLMLEAVDSLKHLKDLAAEGRPQDFDAAPLIGRLHAFAAETRGEAVEAPAAGPEHEDDSGESDGAAVHDHDRGPFRLQVYLADDCAMRVIRARLVLDTCTQLGSIFHSDPTYDQVDALSVDPKRVLVVLDTNEEAQVVRAALKGVSEVKRVVLQHARAADAEALADGVSSAAAAADQAGRRAGATPEAATVRTQSLRVSVEHIDALLKLVGELVIDRNRLVRLSSDLGDNSAEAAQQALRETIAHVSRVTEDMQARVMATRMLPIDQVFARFPRLVRDVARQEGKDVELVMEGGDTEIDRSVVELIVDPLTHMLRNSVSHGVESPTEREAAGKPRTGTVRLSARHEEGAILVKVTDDGKGIDLAAVKRKAIAMGLISQARADEMNDIEATGLIFTSGLSTRQQVGAVAGRGVGMDVVSSQVEKLGGTIETVSAPGKGATFTLRLPLTLAIIRALLVETCGELYALPLPSVIRAVHVQPKDIHLLDGRPAVQLAGSVLPLWDLREVMGCGRERRAKEEHLRVVVVGAAERRLGLIVDRLHGDEELVIKPLGGALEHARRLAGAALLGNGRIALIADVQGIMQDAYGAAVAA